MNQIIATGSIVSYVAILLLFRDKQIIQQFLLYLVFIISATYYQGLDIALPSYFVASLIPFLRGTSKIDRITFLGICVFGGYLVYGIFFQNAQRAITMFISRCWQFLVFYIVLNNRKRTDHVIVNYNLILTLSFLVESVLAAYLFVTKKNINSIVRLTAGAQPITGNTAIVVIPILIFSLFLSKNTKEQTKTVFIAFLLAVWVALSGTRGYELVYALILVWIIWVYIFKLSATKHSNNRLFVFAVLAMLASGILIVVPQYMDKVLSLLRLNQTSIGIRTYENVAAREFFINAPFSIKIFGIGIGGQLGQYTEFKDAIFRQFALGMWNRSHYLYDSGALFHNLYANLLCNMGIVGIITIIALIIGIWKRINIMITDKYINILFMLFFICILFMNYYRWSTDCGIAIMIIFALMLKCESQLDKQHS